MNTNTNEHNELTPLITLPAATTRRGFIKRTAAVALVTTFAFDAFAETSICGIENCSSPHYSIFLNSHSFPDKSLPISYVRPGGTPFLTAYLIDGGDKPASTAASPVESYKFSFASNFSWNHEPSVPKQYPAPGINKGLGPYTCFARVLYMAILISEKPVSQGAVTMQNGILPPNNFIDSNFSEIGCSWKLDDYHDSEATKTADPDSKGEKSAAVAITPIELKIDFPGTIGITTYGTLSGSITWKIGYEVDKNSAELRYTVGASGTLKLTHYVVNSNNSGFVTIPNSNPAQLETKEHNVDIGFSQTYTFAYGLDVKKLPQIPPTPMPTVAEISDDELPVGVTLPSLPVNQP